jgi:hypothetical protein
VPVTARCLGVSKNTVSKCKGGPTKTSLRKLTRQRRRRVTADLHCNIKQEVHLVLNDMVQSSKTMSSTATGSSDVYSISKVNIVQYILISQIEFGLAHDSRSSDKRLQEVSGFNLN